MTEDTSELVNRLRRLSNLPGFGVIGAGLSAAQEREVQKALVDAAEALEAKAAAPAFIVQDNGLGEPLTIQFAPGWIDYAWQPGGSMAASKPKPEPIHNAIRKTRDNG